MDKYQKEINTKSEYLKESYEVLFHALYGSQNYGLETATSDVDSKAIILLDLKDIIRRKEISTKVDFSDGSQVDVKDVLNMFSNFKKMNINFLEILFSEWNWKNPSFKEELDELLNMREALALADTKRLVLASMGMAHNKLKALEKVTDRTKEQIKQYGYVGKELSHILRLENLVHALFEEGLTFAESLKTFTLHSKELVLASKASSLELKEARYLAESSVDRLKKYADSFEGGIDKSILKSLDDLGERIVIKSIRDNF